MSVDAGVKLVQAVALILKLTTPEIFEAAYCGGKLMTQLMPHSHFLIVSTIDIYQHFMRYHVTFHSAKCLQY